MQQPTPHTETIVKTLIVKKRGKRYFDCLLGGHKAKLVINEVSDGLALDTVAKMQLKDLSKTTRFGTTLTFEAVAIESERDGKKLYEQAKRKNEALRWLKYAEDDVREGSYTTNAMSKAIFFCQPYPELCERVKAMEAKGWANAQAANERKIARKQEREAASAAAWNDEAHVEDNRQQYRAKFAAVTLLLKPVLDVDLPDAAFYLWAKAPICDTEFARELYRQQHVTVLPGSFLAREAHGSNPGQNYVRIALVAPLDECIEAARRIVEFCKTL